MVGNGRATASKAIREALRLAPDLASVRDQLVSNPDEVTALAFPEDDPGLASRAIVGPGGGSEMTDTAVTAERRRILEAGARGLTKLEESGPEAPLEQDEVSGLEAIVSLIGRPALFIHDGTFSPPLSPWEILDQFRDGIASASKSVGRIGIEGQNQLPYAGTGFFVGDGVVLTNCHVAVLFATGRSNSWVLRTGLMPKISLRDDPDKQAPVELAIDRVIGIHPVLDIALLGLTPSSRKDAPVPLTVASAPPGDVIGRDVYALGYPAFDPRNPAPIMSAVFADRYNVKRLQPGKVLDGSGRPVLREKPCSGSTPAESVFAHDCSTLGGNSGSCVIDLESNQVLGLHYAGRYMEHNQAVALWTLKDDPLMSKAGVNFD